MYLDDRVENLRYGHLEPEGQDQVVALGPGWEVLSDGLLTERLERGDFSGDRERVEEAFRGHKEFAIAVGPCHGRYRLLERERGRERERE